MRFIDVIHSMIDTYNSLDLRVVAFYTEGVWKSILTVIRFRLEDVEELKKEHKKIEKYGLIRNDEFRVGLYALPITEWDRIEKNWYNSFIQLPDFSVNIPKDDLNRVIGDTPSHSDQDAASKEWKSFYLISNNDNKYAYDRNVLSNQNKNAVKYNFKNIEDYLGTIFEINENQIGWGTSLNIISVPMFFNIDSVMFDEQTITIKGKCYPKAEIKLVVDIHDREHNGQRGKMRQKEILELKTNDSKVVQSFTINKTIDKVSIEDAFEIYPRAKKEILLQNYGGWMQWHWPQNQINKNYMSAFFKKFIPIEDLRKMLIDFEAKDTKNKRLIFERGISWLLTLLGFNIIWLDQGFEKMRSNADVVIDILGTNNENQVILVNVTIGILETKDVTKLLLAKRGLEKEFPESKVEFLLILFSGQSVNELRKTIGNNEVMLVGNYEIEQILQLIENEKIDEAKKLLTSFKYYDSARLASGY